jgi:hypothetical protein
MNSEIESRNPVSAGQRNQPPAFLDLNFDLYHLLRPLQKICDGYERFRVLRLLLEGMAGLRPRAL